MRETDSIRSGYRIRDVPEYFDDDLGGVIWQPDVYADAQRLARAIGAARVIDVGAGDGAKLAPLYPGLDVIGLDFGRNVERSAELYPFGIWRDHDLDSEEPLPVSTDELQGSVVVCSDVIEHLRMPERLLAKLRTALQSAPVLLLSTPERELWRGVRSLDPPRNPHHVREWSIREFGELLRHHGFDHVSIGLTRSNDRTDEAHTIDALATRDRDRLDRLVPVLIDRPIPPARHPIRARLRRAARIVVRG